MRRKVWKINTIREQKPPFPTFPAAEEQSKQVQSREVHFQELTLVDSSQVRCAAAERRLEKPALAATLPPPLLLLCLLTVQSRPPQSPRSPAPAPRPEERRRRRRSPSDCKRLLALGYIKQAAAEEEPLHTLRDELYPSASNTEARLYSRSCFSLTRQGRDGAGERFVRLVESFLRDPAVVSAKRRLPPFPATKKHFLA